MGRRKKTEEEVEKKANKRKVAAEKIAVTEKEKSKAPSVEEEDLFIEEQPIVEKPALANDAKEDGTAQETSPFAEEQPKEEPKAKRNNAVPYISKYDIGYIWNGASIDF